MTHLALLNIRLRFRVAGGETSSIVSQETMLPAWQQCWHLATPSGSEALERTWHQSATLASMAGDEAKKHDPCCEKALCAVTSPHKAWGPASLQTGPWRAGVTKCTSSTNALTGLPYAA